MLTSSASGRIVSSRMNQAQPSTTAAAALRRAPAQKTATGVFDTWSGSNLWETRIFTPRLRWGVRYSQADPIGLWGADWHLFSYAELNPLKYVDPLGLCSLSADMSKCLKELFGPDVDQVEILERQKKKEPKYIITTRKNKIILRWPTCEDFKKMDAVVLEEYFHVIKQWNTGKMTKLKYGIEHMKNGYDNNKFEVEAWEFVSQNIDAYQDCLKSCAESATSVPPPGPIGDP